MSGRVEFPQPMVEAPAYQSKYWYPSRGEVYSDTWGMAFEKGGTEAERAALALGEIYATESECAQRIAYDAQEMARLVIPAWLRALGPDVELLCDGEWEKYNDLAIMPPSGWAGIDPKYFRAKPRDVVVTVNGKEYRWPQTVTKGEPRGDRYVVTVCGVFISANSTGDGNFGAIKAAAGESQ